MVTGGNLKRSFHRIVTPLTEYEPDFARVAKEMIRNKRMHDVILVDKVIYHCNGRWRQLEEILSQNCHSTDRV